MIDTHTHLFVEEFKDDLPETIQRAKDAGITKLLMPNIDDTSVDDLLMVCDEYKDYCFPMIGFHPTSVDSNYKKRVEFVRNLLVQQPDRFIGIGEVGLDFYWDTTFKKEQIKVFDEQINWALEYDKPLVIHCREAFNDLYDVMLPYKDTKLRGIIHSFTGTNEDAEKMLSFNNFIFGINGVVTFKKSTLPEVIKDIPLSRIVLETDSPYLAPVPYRGRRNESSYIVKVAEKIASVYDMDLKQIISQTDENATKMFHIDA